MSFELEPVILCRKCCERITFDGSRRGPAGRLIPLSWRNPEQIHECPISWSFPCKRCSEQIYLDKKVLSAAGNQIPLDWTNRNTTSLQE